MKTPKQYRHALGWSVNQAADLFGVNERTLRRWEYGELPTPKAILMLYAIAEHDLALFENAESIQRHNRGGLVMTKTRDTIM